MPTTDPKALEIMDQRFGHDSLIALATSLENMPSVRAVNAWYSNGCFYVITYATTKKMRHIALNPNVAICGDWFTAQGVGENMGHVLSDKNMEIMQKLREVFSSWYSNGHTNETDPNTILLRIRLTSAVLADHGTWYELEW